MKALYSSVSAPFRFRNLEIFFLRGPQSIPDRSFIPLHEALEERTVIVHETGDVGQLEVENHSEKDLFIQAGDVVKGGKQDRTLGVDLVVSGRGGRAPIPAFCVESGRWSKRRNESEQVFSKSDTVLAPKALRLAAKLGRNQMQVWESVAMFQSKMGTVLNAEVQCAESPSSYQLSMEQGALKNRIGDYFNALQSALEEFNDAVGLAFAINGKPNSADVYGSHDLFRRLWNRQLTAAVTEAVMEAGAWKDGAESGLSSESIDMWLKGMTSNSHPQVREVCPGVWLRTTHHPEAAVFDTVYGGESAPILHRNVISTT